MSFSEDIRSILSRLRARDVEEMREQGFDKDAVAAGFATPAVLARIFSYGGRPAAVVTFHAITPKALAVSMVATSLPVSSPFTADAPQGQPLISRLTSKP